MSGRGGRGGGRGGRGGARGGRGNLPWDYDPAGVQEQPKERYPKTYKPPRASNFPLSTAEARAVTYFVQLRRDFHNSTLYTHKHLAPDAAGTSSSLTDPVCRAYGQQQANARYGVKSKATVDPFLSVPMYSHKFVHEARTLPDFRGREVHHELFPENLWNTIDGTDDGGKAAAKASKRGLKRKSMAAGGDLEEDDEDDEDVVGRHKRRGPETDAERRRRIEEAAQGKDEEGENLAEEDPEEEEDELSQEDDDFEEDEDGGDYDAEQYFDGGDDDYGDEEGGGESAMDF
ncbi:DNA-directed RNA polymerase III subunit RPC7 [Apiospora marii]|uniref:DNA-directed RNA polymerase III subunit n=1 Tax=Apiospora marii TaxID=335849 RepID=A0ABR1SHM8_9PEZI